MPLLLGAIPWRLLAVIGICAGIALGAVYITSQLKKIGRLEAQLDSAVEISNANAEIALKATAEAQRVQGLMLERDKARNAIRHKADERKARIYESPPSEDGPLASVLRDTLNSLPARPHSDTVSGTTVSASAP